MGTWVFFPGIKQPRHEPDDSPHSSTEIKNKSNYTTILPTSLHGIYMDNVTFLFTFLSNRSIRRAMTTESAQWLDNGLDNQGIVFWYLARQRIFLSSVPPLPHTPSGSAHRHHIYFTLTCTCDIPLCVNDEKYGDKYQSQRNHIFIRWHSLSV